MATPATTVKYASRGAVHGSNAYDLSKVRAHAAAPAEYERIPAVSPEIRPGVAPAPRTSPGKKPGRAPSRTAPQPNARPSHKSQRACGISVYSAIGFVVVAVLMVFVLLAHVRYTEVTNKTAQLQAQLTQLSDQERKLKVAYGNAYDVNEVEQIATKQLGMSKPTESQIVKIEVAAQDKAVISETPTVRSTTESMATFLASLVAYFK